MAGSVVQFTLVGILFTLTLAAMTGVQARRAGRDQASQSFEQLARATAATLSPFLDASATAGSADGSILRRQVEALRAAGPVSRVTVWNASGQALWTSDAAPAATLPAAAGAALAEGSVVTPDIATRAAGDTGSGSVLETFVGVRDVHGTPLVLGLEEPYDTAVGDARRTLEDSAVTALAALVLLQLVQIPLALRLARRLRRAQEAQAELLQAAVDASDAERRRIAAEMHDHVVPELTGLIYDLDTARLQQQSHDAGGAAVLGRTAEALRTTITGLRALLVSMVPTRLPEADLGAALAGLAAAPEQSGVQVRLQVGDGGRLPRHVAALFYRCAGEALRNVVAHSGATTVDLTVQGTGRTASLIIEDDGCGFDCSQLAERHAAGHLGLRALGSFFTDAGGSLVAFSAPGRGTRLVATLPLRDLRWPSEARA